MCSAAQVHAAIHVCTCVCQEDRAHPPPTHQGHLQSCLDLPQEDSGPTRVSRLVTTEVGQSTNFVVPFLFFFFFGGTYRRKSENPQNSLEALGSLAPRHSSILQPASSDHLFPLPPAWETSAVVSACPQWALRKYCWTKALATPGLGPYRLHPGCLSPALCAGHMPGSTLWCGGHAVHTSLSASSHSRGSQAPSATAL